MKIQAKYENSFVSKDVWIIGMTESVTTDGYSMTSFVFVDDRGKIGVAQPQNLTIDMEVFLNEEPNGQR